MVPLDRLGIVRARPSGLSELPEFPSLHPSTGPTARLQPSHPPPVWPLGHSLSTKRCMLPKERVERDEEDLVRLYLTDIGQYPLLTKDDEVRLAQAIEAGAAGPRRDRGRRRPSRPARKRELRRELRARRGRRAHLRAVEPAPGRVDRQEVPGLGPAAARPHPGGQPRPDARRREVRLAQGLQVLDLRHLVDPPGHHPRHRQHRPHHPPARPRRRHARPPAEGPGPARAQARPPGHAGRAVGSRSRCPRTRSPRPCASRPSRSR